jgi:hypothetical protein
VREELLHVRVIDGQQVLVTHGDEVIDVPYLRNKDLRGVGSMDFGGCITRRPLGLCGTSKSEVTRILENTPFGRRA